MKFGMGRMVMAALVGLAFIGGTAHAVELDAPIISSMDAKPSTVRLRVKAGLSGAQSGFTAQWMKKSDFDARGGWAPAGDPTLMSGDFTGVPVWTTAGNAGDYTLAPLQWMAIELGQLFDETGVNATFVEELEANVLYVVRVYSRADGASSASQPTPNLVVQTSPPTTNCTFTHGYWKNHASAWPVLTLKLGNVTYNQSQLLQILSEPSHGNGLVILAHQLIAAKLNIAYGANASFISPTIAAADAQIGNLVIPPVGSGYLAPSSTSANSHALDDWNNGKTGPGHCGEVAAHPATWGRIKSTYRD